MERESAEGGGPCDNEEWAAFQKGMEERMKIQDGGDYAQEALKWIKQSANG